MRFASEDSVAKVKGDTRSCPGHSLPRLLQKPMSNLYVYRQRILILHALVIQLYPEPSVVYWRILNLSIHPLILQYPGFAATIASYSNT
jgi:hypothetical protein